MNRYIDADKLIAEIDRRIGIKENLSQRPEMSDMKESLQDIIGAYKGIKSFITSFQQEQPEVDLEKEIKRFLSNATKMNKGEWRGKYPISDIGFRAVARHFYELGQCTKYQQDREEFAKLKAKEWQDGYDEGYAKGLNAR